MQGNLALCCKAMLPLLYKGIVSVRLDHHDDEAEGEKPLSQLTRCLSQQPDGVSHLELFSIKLRHDTCDLIDLRCAHALPAWPWVLLGHGLAVPLSDTQEVGLIAVWLLADTVCCPTCAPYLWRTLHCPCRRSSQSPRVCNVLSYRRAALQTAQMAF